MDIKIARWVGRALCFVLFLLWGIFFLEHLSFFTQPNVELPPPSVWLLQIVHGLLLISYLVGLRFERAGSIGILIFGLIFFVSAGAAWYLLLISLSPIFFFGYTWIRKSQSKKTTVPS